MRAKADQARKFLNRPSGPFASGQVVKNGGTCVLRCRISASQIVTDGTPSSSAIVVPSMVTWSTRNAVFAGQMRHFLKTNPSVFAEHFNGELARLPAGKFAQLTNRAYI